MFHFPNNFYTLVFYVFRGYRQGTLSRDGLNDDRFTFGIIHLVRSQNFSEKLTFFPLHPPPPPLPRNVSFSENFANVLTE